MPNTEATAAKRPKKYIVLHDGKICFQGSSPFIGTLAQAKDQADFLKSCYLEDSYIVCSVTFLDYQGKLNAKYYEAVASTPANNSKSKAVSNKRTVKRA